MPARVRKQAYIEPYREERLKQLAAATGITGAALIRQALDLGLARVKGDTNVLVYAFDRTEPVRQRRAIEVLTFLEQRDVGVLATQVLAERAVQRLCVRR